jgi:hypothetical protein
MSATALGAAAGTDLYAWCSLSHHRNHTLARSVPELWQGWQETLLMLFAHLHKLLAQLSSSAQ